MGEEGSGTLFLELFMLRHLFYLCKLIGMGQHLMKELLFKDDYFSFMNNK